MAGKIPPESATSERANTKHHQVALRSGPAGRGSVMANGHGGPWLPAWEPQEDEIDPGTPHAARVYDYWLGGKQNFAADRMVADLVADAYPHVRAAARANRGFGRRAAAWMARQGIRQFLDVGCGLPSAGSTHQVVRREDPGARVLYADHDAMVACHARALLAVSPGVQAVRGDVRDPDGILASREAAQVLRRGEPAGLLLTAVLHHVQDAEDPWGLVRRFMAALAPGSCVAISHGSLDKLPPDAAAEALEVYAMVREPAVMRTWEQVRAMFSGLELVAPWKDSPPWVVTVDGWAGPEVPLTSVPVTWKGGEALWGSVARKTSMNTRPRTSARR